MANELDIKHHAAYKTGKVTGFGASLFVFVSIFYVLVSFLGKMPSQIQYWHLISLAFVLYALGLAAGRKKWL
jgi:hypothetical protein